MKTLIRSALLIEADERLRQLQRRMMAEPTKETRRAYDRARLRSGESKHKILLDRARREYQERSHELMNHREFDGSRDLSGFVSRTRLARARRGSKDFLVGRARTARDRYIKLAHSVGEDPKHGLKDSARSMDHHLHQIAHIAQGEMQHKGHAADVSYAPFGRRSGTSKRQRSRAHLNVTGDDHDEVAKHLHDTIEKDYPGRAQHNRGRRVQQSNVYIEHPPEDEVPRKEWRNFHTPYGQYRKRKKARSDRVGAKAEKFQAKEAHPEMAELHGQMRRAHAEAEKAHGKAVRGFRKKIRDIDSKYMQQSDPDHSAWEAEHEELRAQHFAKAREAGARYHATVDAAHRKARELGVHPADGFEYQGVGRKTRSSTQSHRNMLGHLHGSRREHRGTTGSGMFTSFDDEKDADRYEVHMRSQLGGSSERGHQWYGHYVRWHHDKAKKEKPTAES